MTSASNQSGQRLASLPLHSSQPCDGAHYRLRVDGLVQWPLELSVAELEGLAQQSLTDDFTCLEGWTVPGLVWQGVPVPVVLELAGARATAGWIQASAGAFSVALPLAEARRGLLALRLGNEPLPVEHGGPVRLVIRGGACYTSVKWLDHLELRQQPAPSTGRTIALERLTAHGGAGTAT